MAQKQKQKNKWQYDLDTIRHSFAHVMAAAVKKLHPSAKFGIGPTIEDGFYYDFELPVKLGEQDFGRIEHEMRKIISDNIPFEREEMSIGEAIKLFDKNLQPYKVELLQDIWNKGTTAVVEFPKEEADFVAEGLRTLISIYKSGDFVDLCRGPHIEKTGDLKPYAFKLLKTAAAYWRGNEKNPQLQRIYAVAFESQKELDAWVELQEEIQKRDHREIGKKLDLFSFHAVAPGAPFWHPNGMIVVKELEKYWREKHDSTGYAEVSTPILVKKDLWEQSGHWQHYKENMFVLQVDEETYALKPMNCPEATIIYSNSLRSYKDLPMRLSEIGRLHRNELSGALGGLLRVRQITMDDAHIFCRADQIGSEISGVLDLMVNFYKLFGFSPTYYLSTKPDEAMGDEKLWQKAESELAGALKKNKISYKIKPGEGAFYGPKIDVEIKDSLKRSWQLATIQLDFQLPERFDLSYVDAERTKRRPVMIHRAIFGSFERFLGILLEHLEGNLPLWLSPLQVAVLPVSAAHKKFAQSVEKELKGAGVRVVLFDENETIGKRIREAEMKKIPYILVVGDKEIKAKSVAVRTRGSRELTTVKLSTFTKQVAKEIEERK